MCCSSTDDTRTLARINSASAHNTTKANVCTVPGYMQRHRCAGSGHEGMMGKKGTNALAACPRARTHTYAPALTHTHTHTYAGAGLGHTERQQATWQGHNTHSAWSHTHTHKPPSHTEMRIHVGYAHKFPQVGVQRCALANTNTHTQITAGSHKHIL